MLGIEIPLTETLKFLKPYNKYVCRESLKQKNDNKERESLFLKELNVYTHLHLPGAWQYMDFDICSLC